MKRIDVGAVRERFPIFEKQVYINSCSQGALSLDVKQAYEQYLCDWDERGAPWDYWVERAETTRKSIATLLNAHPDEVAVTTSVLAGGGAFATGFLFTCKGHQIHPDPLPLPPHRPLPPPPPHPRPP